MSNKLKNQTSPYLLQHSENPVDWYPWCDEAFEKAREENKPVFLSIGYSTCHWCHVMAHESFEDQDVADILNKYFISIKVDKEERPDIDSIYMSVCQAFTGNGGWPMSIFMTSEQKPFFAGTYFPKTSRYGTIGFLALLITIHDRWTKDKKSLLESAEEVIAYFKSTSPSCSMPDQSEMTDAVNIFKKIYDNNYGGFGPPPKFPTPHNLMFLMDYFRVSNDSDCLEMVEKTLQQMYLGGIFDHVGYGFSRYSTDRYFLVPHFEKMLYDNALLIMAYSKAYDLTQKSFYKEVAEKTASYILTEMKSPEGGFYCAQDADSDGIEGKYYVFEPEEIINVFGKTDGIRFNTRYGITQDGNFEGKNIPNLLNSQIINNDFDNYLPTLRSYRKRRTKLHLDDKMLTSWNAMTITAFAMLYRITKDKKYLSAAKKAEQFIAENLCENDTLFVSYRDGLHSGKGYLDDYAFYILSLISLYEATLDNTYLEKAHRFCDKVVTHFYDEENGGFYLYSKENEQLIFTPKETYDGAIPSGNSAMAYIFVKLFYIIKDNKFRDMAEKQLSFISAYAKPYPAGFCFYLLALSMYNNPPENVVVVLKYESDLDKIKDKFSLDTTLSVLKEPINGYQLLNDKTTFYVCKNQSCMPPSNEIS